MKKKSVNNIILITLSLILVLSFININIFNHIDDYYDKNNQYLRDNLELSDYSSFIEGEGEGINITLHESLLDTSIIHISNISDPTKNTFYEPFPKVENFSSSFVNISIEEIYAPNKNWEIETTTGNMRAIYIYATAFGFQVKGNCILINFSICFTEDFGGGADSDADILIQFRNAEWDNAQIEPGPIILYSTYDIVLNGTDAVWYNYTGLDIKLNVTQTYDNYFFIWVGQVTTPGDARVRIHEQNDGAVDDAILMWYEDLILDLWTEYATDPCLKVGLAPYIYPSNTSLNVEDDSANSGVQDFTNQPAATSFEVEGDGYLENVFIYGRNFDGFFDAVVNVYLYNSTWNGITKKNEPEILSQLLLDTITMPIGGANKWHNISQQHEFLNNSKTANNTWFIGLAEFASGDGRWFYLDDLDYGFSTDNNNETISYEFAGSWNLITNPSSGCPSVDLKLKLDLSPLENVPRPENIGLKINDTAVIGFSDIYGSGYWSSTDVYSSSSGQLKFEVSADWWDVSCKITKVQINYTKTDLKASSKFTIMESGQDVQWNVTRSGGLNFFDPRITHHNTINFTIPATWLNINAFNGPENKTSDIKTRLLNNGYRDVEIIDATNGTFWYLTATSKNLVESIDMYIGSNPINMANFSDVVEFNVTFNKIIGQNDGIIDLSVYSPDAINDKLNFTSVNSTFDSGSEFYLGKWDLSDTVIDYGEFRVQVFWNNDTAAGFREKILTIKGQTDFTLLTPSQEATYYSNQSFNIVVYYKDSNQLKAIDGATIQYNINGQGWQSTSSNNGTIGYYIIPVNCSIFTIDGTKAVEITASKNYYESQTLNYNFNVIIVEEKGKQAGEFPLVIIIIAIVSIAGGIGVATVTIVLLRKRKRINKGI